MGLTKVELASRFFGYQGLGFACLSHFPQLASTWATKPSQGGLSWVLLGLWVTADVMSLVGLIMIGGLVTQQIQTIWYLVGDVLVTVQQLWYHGFVPGTKRWEKRKANEHGAIRVAFNKGVPGSAYYGRVVPHPGSSQSNSLSKDRRDRRPRRGYVQLAPGKQNHSRHGHSVESEESEEELRDKGPKGVRRAVMRAFSVHNNITEPSLMFGLIFLMVMIWALTTYVPRADLPHIPHATPPIRDGEITSTTAVIGFCIAWVGTILYNAPRVHQLYICLKAKATEGIDVWMFIALIGENVGTGISIFIISQDHEHLLAEAAYITGIILALSFDFIFIALHMKFQGHLVEHRDRPWSDPMYISKNDLFEAPNPVTDAYHRKALARERRAHVQDSDKFHGSAGTLHPDARRAARAALEKRDRDLEAAGHNLDEAVYSSGDEARVVAHAKGADRRKKDLQAMGDARARREKQAAVEQQHDEARQEYERVQQEHDTLQRKHTALQQEKGALHGWNSWQLPKVQDSAPSSRRGSMRRGSSVSSNSDSTDGARGR